jgi:hypothetical protein
MRWTLLICPEIGSDTPAAPAGYDGCRRRFPGACPLIPMWLGAIVARPETAQRVGR